MPSECQTSGPGQKPVMTAGTAQSQCKGSSQVEADHLGKGHQDNGWQGHLEDSTHPPCLTSGRLKDRAGDQNAWARMTRQQSPSPTANQKGKNPPCGPFNPQPMLSCNDSRATSTASPSKTVLP